MGRNINGAALAVEMLQGEVTRVTVAAARMDRVRLPLERSRRPSMSSWRMREGRREGAAILQHGAGVDLTPPPSLPHSSLLLFDPSSLHLLIHELRARVGLTWASKFCDDLHEFQKPEQDVKPSFRITPYAATIPSRLR